MIELKGMKRGAQNALGVADVESRPFCPSEDALYCLDKEKMSRHGGNSLVLGNSAILFDFFHDFGDCSTVAFQDLLQSRPPNRFRQEEIHTRVHAFLDITLFSKSCKSNNRS